MLQSILAISTRRVIFVNPKRIRILLLIRLISQVMWRTDFFLHEAHCTKKWSFPLRIFSVTVTKLAVSCGLSPATLLKKSLAQLFSCKFCEISNNFLNNSGRLLLFRQAYNHYKRAFEAARQAYANKNKRISLSRNLASLILFSTKVNLLNVLYLSS